MPAYDGDSFDFWGSGNWYDSSRIRAFTPLKRDGDSFLSGGGPPSPSPIPYFRMQGRDLGASVWRQWTAPNAPDLSATYYAGPPVASWGDIFVLTTWEAL